jgi:uncharacterized protein (DUF2336 family)
MSRESGENVGSKDRVMLGLEIPEETKELLESQDRYMWEALTEAIHNTYGGERLSSPAALDREIELIRRKKRNARERIEEAKDDYHRHEQRLESLKDRREEMAEQAETKADALDQRLQTMSEHGSNAYIGHGSVELLANQWFGGDEKAALDALKERSEDTDYNFAPNRFEKPGMNGGVSRATLRSVRGDADD